MPLYKSRKGDWRWEFQHRNQRYTGAGHKTRKGALEARERKRREIKGGSIPIGMVFEEAANLYLDFSRRRHATKTYNYKKLVYKRFMEYHGNPAIQDTTPYMIHSFLTTRPSNRNYNAHLADKEKISKKTISTLLRHRELGTTYIYLQSPWLSQITTLKSLEGRF